MKSSPDFYFRKHWPNLTVVMFIFIGLLLFSVYMLNNLMQLLLFWPDAKAPPSAEIKKVMGIVSICALLAGAFAVYIIYRVRENILETEFQNLIFAGCMRLNSQFSLIVHREKTGIYCDYNFSKMFSSYGHIHDPFHRLLASEGFGVDSEKALIRALEKGKAEDFTFTLKKKNGSVKKIKVSLEPIDRPAGFFLLRGHK